MKRNLDCRRKTNRLSLRLCQGRLRDYSVTTSDVAEGARGDVALAGASRTAKERGVLQACLITTGVGILTNSIPSWPLHNYIIHNRNPKSPILSIKAPILVRTSVPHVGVAWVSEC